VTRKRLRDILEPMENTGILRWSVTVPLGTNPFILLELFQFAFIGAAIVLITLVTGVWFTEGGITIADITAALEASVLVLAAVMAGFLFLAFLFFSNKYFATFHMDPHGIYHEGSRGADERGEWFSLRIRPYPVAGAIKAARTRSRHLLWDKVDRFQDIPGMRVIILRRGIWYMLRLYTPDAITHVEAVQFLEDKGLVKK
jgi:hypothetical protein